MEKVKLVKSIINVIENKAKKNNLKITDKGTGHAYDSTFWENVLIDDSDIPDIVAKKRGYEIRLRSFWGRPEIDIERKWGKEDYYICINYSDYALKDKQTGDFQIAEVRVDVCNGQDYKKIINLAYDFIDCISLEYEKL